MLSMRSVTALSADVRRAARAAAALSCASAALFAATIAAGAYAAEFAAATLDADGWSVLAGSAVASLAAAYLLLTARDRILLRTGLWFGHVYAHHHLTCGALAGAPASTLAADERSLRTIHSALVDGTAARRMDAIWLPLAWAALASIHPAHAIAAAAFAGTVIVVGRLFKSRADVDASPVTLGELGVTDYPAAANIDAWEVRNRAAVAGTYANEKRKAARHAALGVVATVSAVALGLGTVLLLQQGSTTMLGAAAAALLHMRHAMVALAHAAGATARDRVLHAASRLTQARMASLEVPQQTSQRFPASRSFAPEPTLDFGHAA